MPPPIMPPPIMPPPIMPPPIMPPSIIPPPIIPPAIMPPPIMLPCIRCIISIIPPMSPIMPPPLCIMSGPGLLPDFPLLPWSPPAKAAAPRAVAVRTVAAKRILRFIRVTFCECCDTIHIARDCRNGMPGPPENCISGSQRLRLLHSATIFAGKVPRIRPKKGS